MRPFPPFRLHGALALGVCALVASCTAASSGPEGTDDADSGVEDASFDSQGPGHADGGPPDGFTDAPADAPADAQRDSPSDAPSDSPSDSPTDSATAPEGSVAGWSWVNPLPTGNDLNAVWESSASDVWAVGDLGTIVHYDGSAWTSWPSGTSQSLRAMWSASATDVWAVGDAGTVLHWDGASWSAVPSGTTLDLQAISGVASDQVWIVGGGATGGVILMWNGSTLSTASSTTAAGYFSVWASSATSVWVGGGFTPGAAQQDTLWNWNGQSLTAATLTPAPPLYVITTLWGSGPDDVWAVPNGGNFAYRWNGSVWAYTGNTPSEALATTGGLWGTGPNDVWSATGPHWNGSAWSAPTSCNGAAISGTSDGDVWFVGAAGSVKHQEGSSCPALGPAGWSDVTSAVWGPNPNDVYLVGAEMRHWDGSTWTVSSLPTLSGYDIDAWSFVWGSADDDIWIATSASSQSGTGSFNFVSHWDGQSWTTPSLVGGPDVLRALWGSGPNDVWLVSSPSAGATNGLTLHWDGTSWAQVTSNPVQGVGGGRGVWGSSASDIWIGGSPLTHWDGTTWTPQAASAPTGMLWGAAANDVWVVDDGELADGAAESTVSHFDGTQWTSVATLPFQATHVSGSSSNDAWISGPAGAAWHWNGASWTPTLTGTDNSLGDIAGVGAGQAWAVGGTTVLRYKP